MSARAFVLSTVAPAVASVVLCGCGGDDKKDINTGQPGAVQCPPGQYFDGQYCQVQGAPPPTAAPTGTAAPTATATPPPVATAAPGPAATPMDEAAAQAAATLLTPLAQQFAPPGAKPLGSIIAGQFAQGQSLERTVQMQPGKCYTVVGAGVPGQVQNLDIQLLPLVPFPGMSSPVIAADDTVAPDAVVGKQPNCFKWALPVAGAMKVVVTVSQGQGIAAAQIFEK